MQSLIDTKKMPKLCMFLLACLVPISGLFRELVVAYYYGVSSIADSFFYLITVSAILVEMFVGTPLTVAVVPHLYTFGKSVSDNKKIANILLFVLCALLVLILIVSFLYINLYDENIEGKQTIYLYGFVTATVIYTVSVSSLQLYERFLFLLACQIFNNLAVPIVVWLGVVFIGKTYFVLYNSLILGSCISVLFSSYYFLKNLNYLPLKNISNDLKKIYKSSLRSVITLGMGNTLVVLLASHYLIREFAIRNDESVASYYYAYRLYEIPLTLAALIWQAPFMNSFAKNCIPTINNPYKFKLIKKTNNFILIMGAISILSILLCKSLVLLKASPGFELLNEGLEIINILTYFSINILLESMLFYSIRMLNCINGNNFGIIIGFLTVALLFLLLKFNEFAGFHLKISIIIPFVYYISIVVAMFKLGRFLNINIKYFLLKVTCYFFVMTYIASI